MKIHRTTCPDPRGIPCDFCDEPPTTHYHVRPFYIDEDDYIACICDSERCMAEAMVLLAAAAREVSA